MEKVSLMILINVRLLIKHTLKKINKYFKILVKYLWI